MFLKSILIVDLDWKLELAPKWHSIQKNANKHESHLICILRGNVKIQIFFLLCIPAIICTWVEKFERTVQLNYERKQVQVIRTLNSLLRDSLEFIVQPVTESQVVYKRYADSSSYVMFHCESSRNKIVLQPKFKWERIFSYPQLCLQLSF